MDHTGFVVPAGRDILTHRKVRRKTLCLTNDAKQHEGKWFASHGSISRRDVVRLLMAAPITLATTTMSTGSVAIAAAKKGAKLDKLTAPIIMCRRVMEPVGRYIEEGAWDKGRTNVNYCTRVLAMRKNMRDAADLLTGDAYYDALDIMGEMVNNMSQLDASLYTPLFIPADDGQVTVEQGKYQTQARDFYKDALNGLDQFLTLIPKDIMEKATFIANATKYEIPIEHE